MEDIRIALASKPAYDGETTRNMTTLLDTMTEAARAGAGLVCFGEAFLQGFDGLCWDWAIDKDRAVTRDAPEILRIRDTSAILGVDVLFGYIEREGEALYSSCMLVERGQIRHNYRRISKGWKEYTRTDGHYREGDAPRLFDYRGRRCAIALCGDLWDAPEKFRLGTDVLFWPVYCSYAREDWLGGTLDEYARQCAPHAPLTLMINSITPGDSVGGCAAFRAGQIDTLLEPGTEGLLLLDLKG